MTRQNALRLCTGLTLLSLPVLGAAQARPCPPSSLSVDGQGAVQTPCAPTTTLSQQYPGDIGIGTDADVVWAENFEQGTVSAVTSRYGEAANPAGMLLTSDRPAQSRGLASLRMQSSGAGPSATHLFKNLANSAGGDDEWYVRYYTKYGAGGTWNHTGVWFGGYNPPLNYPFPRAGQRPNGDDRFSIGFESLVPGSNIRMDFYNYWMTMHSWMDVPSGNQAYYGNTILHDPAATIAADGWTCVEVHVRLNTNLASAAGAELEVWLNDVSIERYNETGPLGYWVKEKFCPETTPDATCTAFRTPSTPLVPLNLQFRTTNSLKLNYLWLQNYVTDPGVGNVWYDDVVVGKRRVGCIQ